MPANEHYRGYQLPTPQTGFALRRVCFDIPDNDEYKRAFWDRVFQLAQPYNWQQDNYADQRNHVAAEYWEQLLYANLVRFIEEDDCGVPQPNTCQTYPPTAPFIQWFPNDPVYTPDFVGEGYNYPAWYFATSVSNLALGSQYGDVITSIDRFPPGSLPEVLPASGLPRFRINVNGTGVVKTKLVNMFAGSLIQTTVDDDIGTLNFVDVARDTIAAPPETNGELAVEFNLTTPGAHHIDFIVISWINSSVPFLHHGGGLRSVELCGFDEMPIYSPPFRFTEACGLEFYDGETWQPVTGWTDFAPTCFQGLPGADGADGADGAEGADGADGATGATGATGAQLDFYSIVSDTGTVLSSLVEGATVTTTGNAIPAYNLNRNKSDSHNAVLKAAISITGGIIVSQEFTTASVHAGGQLSSTKVHTLKPNATYGMRFANLGNQTTNVYFQLGFSEHYNGYNNIWLETVDDSFVLRPGEELLMELLPSATINATSLINSNKLSVMRQK